MLAGCFSLSLKKTAMRFFAAALALLTLLHHEATANDSTIHYALPDSVKAVSFIVDVKPGSHSRKKEVHAGIRVSEIGLAMEAEKKEKEVSFCFPENAKVIATGVDVETDEDELEWDYDWKEGNTYKLLIASATDSADNFSIYSGYIWLPEAGKWKLIGTCRIDSWSTSLRGPAAFYSTGKHAFEAGFSNAWVQRAAGSWKNLDDAKGERPSIMPMPAYDSLAQYQFDRAIIEKAMASGQTDVNADTAGVYYRVLDAGTGKTVTVNDTVTVKYQLRIFGTTGIIDQATEKPATFPLNRLIKAWQLAVPLVKTGGRLKIVIPSGLAYSIRTRAPKIPPNSILEFDIEVLDTKPAK